ncbi:hypothetical protein DLM45_05555 [Hyphomicrobium methylovorum]|uniref:hypothetical protein n=1 Tax=Hyphomicrobium methylovorum TaxID=84 RepID=UPI0015E65192|nr:hypothetical protein [Hyphomicrobium methylovorum]MBA2125690.1 hypothetical protein [Hyphomicrobium methylovorum]MBR2536490.1 hypothetical protein [Hyphomicrobium sp.]
MQKLISIAGFTAALVMCAVSGVMNYLFMASLGKTPLEGQVLGAASAAADVLKALLPFFIAWSWAAKRMVAAFSGALAFAFFAGFSLLSAIGFAAATRGTLVESREGLTQSHERVLGSLRALEARRGGLPTHRPAAVLEEEIEAKRQNRRWHVSRDCTNATEGESRSFCAEYFRLRAELAAAQEADRLSVQIGSLQLESVRLRESGAGQDSDPQSSLLSRITGQKPEPVRLALTIAVALLVEIGASLGLFLASGHNSPLGPSSPILQQAKPAGCIEEFCLEALTAAPHSALSMEEILRAYEAWCASKGLTASDVDTVSEVFAAIALAIPLPYDGKAYRGLALSGSGALS